MLYGWWDTGCCCSFTNSSPHIDPPIWPKDFKCWFVSPKDFIPLRYCPVFVHLSHLELFDIVLLPQQWFLIAILPYRPTSQSLLLIEDTDRFFSWHWFSCAVRFGAVSKLVTLMKLSTALIIAFGLPALLLVLFYPIYWCLLIV